MENPIKMDDLGVPLFSETSIYRYRLYCYVASFRRRNVLCLAQDIHGDASGRRGKSAPNVLCPLHVTPVVQSQEIYIHIQTNQFRSQTIETTTTYQNQNTIIYHILFKHFFKKKHVHHIFPPLSSHRNHHWIPSHHGLKALQSERWLYVDPPLQGPRKEVKWLGVFNCFLRWNVPIFVWNFPIFGDISLFLVKFPYFLVKFPYFCLNLMWNFLLNLPWIFFPTPGPERFTNDTWHAQG